VPRLAIILSAVGSVESWEATLVSILENRPADCEIVVALREPYADPYDLKDEVRFLEPPRRARATQVLNAALAATRAPLVHLLASGCKVSEGWTDAPVARFGDRRLAAVSPLVWDASQPKRLLAAGVGYRIRGQRVRVGEGLSAAEPEALSTVIGPCLFAAFYRRAALDFVGGFSTQLAPRQADADLALVLRAAGFTSAVESRSTIYAGSQVDRAEGAGTESLADERLFWRNWRGAGSTRALVSHLALACADVLGGLPGPRAVARFAGRLRGALEFGSHARHQRLVNELAARAPHSKPPGENLRIDRSHELLTRPDAVRTRMPAR